MHSVERRCAARRRSALFAGVIGSAVAGCAISAIEELPDGGAARGAPLGAPQGATGGTEITFVVPGESRVSELFYQVAGNAIAPHNGIVELDPAESRGSAQLALPTGDGYTLRVFAVAAEGPRLCRADLDFDIPAAASVKVLVALTCDVQLDASVPAPTASLDAAVLPGSVLPSDGGAQVPDATAAAADGGASSPVLGVGACDACRIAVCASLKRLQTALACMVITGVEPKLAGLLCGHSCGASP
jgi:hypothetical protein